MSINGISDLNHVIWKNKDSVTEKKNKKKEAMDAILEEIKKENGDKSSDTKSETNSDIVTKPDGSRVLVMTTQIGGMETSVSVELSKPNQWDNGSKIEDKYVNANDKEFNEQFNESGYDFKA
jgi:hypothetical protein